MTIAFCCLLIAGLLPYVAVGFAKSGGGYDNARPRESMAKFEGLQARAVAAHANSFEAFPFFAAVVLLAAITRADPFQVNTLSVLFIAARLAYIAAYLTEAGIDSVILCGNSTSGCVRATAVDSLSHGYRTIVPMECVADKHESYHFANLTDLQLKYADVVTTEDVVRWLQAR